MLFWVKLTTSRLSSRAVVLEPRRSVRPSPSLAFAAVAAASLQPSLVQGSPLGPGGAAGGIKLQRLKDEWTEFGGHFGPRTEMKDRVRPWLVSLNLTREEQAQQSWPTTGPALYGAEWCDHLRAGGLRRPAAGKLQDGLRQRRMGRLNCCWRTGACHRRASTVAS